MPKQDLEKNLQVVKRRRSTQRMLVTKISNTIEQMNEQTELNSLKFQLSRLEETFVQLESLDREYQDQMNDSDYEKDCETTMEYVERTKEVIWRTKDRLNNKQNRDNLPLSDSEPRQHEKIPQVRLPTLKIEPFTGDVEHWPSFWQQFTNSIDNNPSLSVIDKHIFLRSYLESDAKSVVDGIIISEDTYETTKQILIKKFGDNNKIIQAHLDYLDNLKAVSKSKPEDLNELFLECNKRIRGLTALGEDINMYGRILTSKILKAFPDDFCNKWITHSKRTDTPYHNLSELMKFLEVEVEGAVTTASIKSRFNTHLNNEPTTSTFIVRSRTTTNTSASKKHNQTLPFCIFCNLKGSHWAQDCDTIPEKTKRIDLLKTAGRCFLCLNKGHHSKLCPKREKFFCRNCTAKHHVAICTNRRVNAIEKTNITPPSTAVNQIHIPERNVTYLQTARVWINGPNGQKKLTRCLLDSGSQSSFIHTRLINHLDLKVIKTTPLKVTAFEGISYSHSDRRQVSFTLTDFLQENQITITAFESSNTYSPQPLISSKSLPEHIVLADPEQFNGHDLQSDPIELLIGSDYYWSIVSTESPQRINKSLALVPSRLGWILSGQRGNHFENGISLTSSNHHVSVCSVTTSPIEDFRLLGSLEAIGMTDEHEANQTLSKRGSPPEIHVFCDSSQRDYGAVIHPRMPKNNKFVTELICSKSRLAPIKKVILFTCAVFTLFTLFTCAVTRGMYSELVLDLTTDQFLVTLDHFVGRRGVPNVIYSDNASTFKVSNKQLSSLWEAVSSSKTDENIEILTPAHFLVGRKLTTLPCPYDSETRPISLTKLWEYHQKITENFWNRWNKEYLLNLKSFHQTKNLNNNNRYIDINDIVLLHEDTRPRHLWKMARVLETTRGRDGLIRSLVLKLGDREFRRPIQQVIPLEVSRRGEDVVNPE